MTTECSTLFEAPRSLRSLVLYMLVFAGYVICAPPLSAQEPGEADRLRALSLELVNKARAEQSLPPLQIGRQVTDAAKAHASDMLKRSYFAHESPDGKNVGPVPQGGRQPLARRRRKHRLLQRTKLPGWDFNRGGLPSRLDEQQGPP